MADQPAPKEKPPAPADDLGLRVPKGFKVTLWADETLANDIYTMAFDHNGDVVVSGPGYIRRLEDTDGDGKADKATDIAETKTGAMGLLFLLWAGDDRLMYVAADGKLAVKRWNSKDRVYENRGPAFHHFPFTEHGGHAIRMSPTGQVVAIAGNNSEFGKWSELMPKSFSKIEGGGIFFAAGTKSLIANGFRNPYDFDFTPLGDIITYDADTERDHLLPWYSPNRLIHVQPGMHHGWRLPGHMRSLARPDYYPDTVPVLADMGRGSPTGVVCYQHTQFPEKYHGGVFLLDWTFGKIYFMPLIPEGTSYKKVPFEVFLEAIGQNGFAPTGARVGPDGSLYVCIGGRGTRGAVYKISYSPNGEMPAMPKAVSDDPVERILNAPQPWEAWSRARMGEDLENPAVRAGLEQIAIDEVQADARRLRALQLLQSVHVRLDRELLRALRLSKSPAVQETVARAYLGDNSVEALDTLVEFAQTRETRVRVQALTTLAENTVKFDPMPAVWDNLGHADQCVRLAAARLYALKGRGNRFLKTNFIDQETNSLRLAMLVVGETMGDGNAPPGLDAHELALKALERAGTNEEILCAFRAIMLACGDWRLDNPPVELHRAYMLNKPPSRLEPYQRLQMGHILRALQRQIGRGNDTFRFELTRLLAMLEDDSPLTHEYALKQITPKSHPTLDFHHLAVLTRLRAAPTASQIGLIADDFLGMEDKLNGLNLRIKQNWPSRIAELTEELIKRYPGIERKIAEHPNLAKPGHVVIAARLPAAARRLAAERFLEAVKANDEFELSSPLIRLLAELPPDQFRPLFRARWHERAMREEMIEQMVATPSEADRGRFLEVLESASPPIAQRCLVALQSLPRDTDPDNLVPILSRLQMAFSEPKEATLRRSLIALFNRQTGQSFLILENATDAKALESAYRPLFTWFAKTYPGPEKKLHAVGADEEAVRKIVPTVKWEAGDVERGRKVYRDRGCQTCHSGSTRIGPDISAAPKRMSRDDLLTAILQPSKDVATSYRVTYVDLKNGQRLSGVVVFESAEGIILQTGAAQTRRISADEIESRLFSRKSLMPDGLLKGIKSEELADLFAFMAKQ